jgi:hypothetical protein
MSSSSQEYSSTYFVHDRSNQDELTHLQLQDALTTKGTILS